MKIGIDIMGGDFAPEAIVLGAIQALGHLEAEDRIVLIGDKAAAEAILKRENVERSNFDFVNTTQVIGMGEHPAKAFAQKNDSSVAVGFGLLAKKQIDGFASAGNTGAMLVGAMYTIKSVPGVKRPSIVGFAPRPGDKPMLILDVGLNSDCKPDVLYQYGIVGSLYAQHVFDIDVPRIALMNIGSEAEKGNILTKAAHELMKDTEDFNFVGNIEGTDLYTSDKADVIVCDGFVGNVILKQSEAVYKLIKRRGIKDDFFDEQFDFENYGGTPILGVNSNVIIGHGVSKAKAIKNMILQTKKVINAKLPERFKEIFE